MAFLLQHRVKKLKKNWVFENKISVFWEFGNKNSVFSQFFCLPIGPKPSRWSQNGWEEQKLSFVYSKFHPICLFWEVVISKEVLCEKSSSRSKKTRKRCQVPSFFASRRTRKNFFTKNFSNNNLPKKANWVEFAVRGRRYKKIFLKIQKK